MTTYEQIREKRDNLLYKLKGEDREQDPVSLAEILLMLSNIPLCEIDFHGDARLKIRKWFGIEKEPTDWTFIDISLPIQEQDEKTLTSLLELIK